MESSPRSSARRAQAATSRTSPRAASPIPTRRPSSATRSPYSRAAAVAIGIRPEATIIVSVGQQARADRIRQMFDQVAARYDTRNRLFSADRDRAAALREMFRVLRPGGRLVILEFAPPPPGLLMRAYRIYLSRLMPAVAGLLSAGEGSAYRYLAETVEAFPEPAELAQQLEGLGFTVAVERLTFGIAALHVAVRRRW